MKWTSAPLKELEDIVLRLGSNLHQSGDRQPAVEQQFDFFHMMDEFIDGAAKGLVEGESFPASEAQDLSRVIRNQVSALAKQHFGWERPLVN